MNSPVIVDTHAHLFKSKRDARDLKADYEIVEFGEKRDVHMSTMGGTVEEMLPAMAAAGIQRSIVLNLFIANWERDRYKRGLPDDMSAAESARRMSQFESELPDGLKCFNRWGCDVAGRHPQLLAYACTDLTLLSPEESSMDRPTILRCRTGVSGQRFPFAESLMHQSLLTQGAIVTTLALPTREHSPPCCRSSRN